MVDRLQSINDQLRNKIKDLNLLVEKAIEKQARIGVKNKKSAESVYATDPDHLVRVRAKEIENTRKAIDHNNAQIVTLNSKLKSLSTLFEGQSLNQPLDWESKYQQQVDLKRQLQQQIKRLEK